MIGVAKCRHGKVGIVYDWGRTPDGGEIAKGVNIITGGKWQSKHPEWMAPGDVAEFISKGVAT